MNSLHHLGVAVSDIGSAVEEAKNYFQVAEVGHVVYDPLQKVTLCLITLQDGTRIELVSGEIVNNFLKETHQLFHHCYEVENIHRSIERLTQNGAKIILPPKPAILFDNRNVCFLSTPFGIIELLEKEVPPLESIYLIGNQTLDPLLQCIKTYAKEIQFSLVISNAPYNQLLVECADPDSNLRQHEGVVFALLGFEDVLHYSNREDLLDQYIQELVTTLEHAVFKAKQFFLIIMPYEQSQVDKYKHSILALQTMRSQQRITLIDLTQYCAYEYQSIIDTKANEIAHIPYKQLFYTWLSDHILRRLHSKMRRPYKLIAVDCDNTLWSGVCAEDTVDNLVVRESHVLLQKKLVELSQQGVLIALLSKNTTEDVWRVFDTHSKMILQKDHILACEINWEPKSKSILKLCEHYQIATTSVVFIDDNLAEIVSVRQALPEVLAIQFSEQNASAITNSWQFDKFENTKEDDIRRDFYIAESQRSLIKESSNDFRNFVHSLQLEIKYHPITPSSYARIEQMLMRVTQFNTSNLTFDGLSSELLEQDSSTLISVIDRFGDYGEVGLILSTKKDNALRISSILLSCRVLGRGVEEKLAEKILCYARTHQMAEVHIQYQESQRNKPAKQFIDYCNPRSEYKAHGAIWYVYDVNSFQYIRKSSETIPVRHVDAKQEILNQIVLNVVNHKSCVQYPVMDDTANFELQLLKKVSELCNVPLQDLSANFVQLGGDSIKATYLASWLSEQFQLNVDMLDILKSPSLSDITHEIVFSGKNTIPVIDKSIAPALSTQKWLYLIDQLKGGSWFYNMPFIFRIDGALDKELFIKSLKSLVNKHVAFHTEFFEETGELFMRRISPTLSLIEVVATNFTDEMILDLYAAETKNAFNLQKGPLIRFILMQRTEMEYFLITNKHHIISDGWSDQILFNDMQQAYGNQGELPIFEGLNLYDYSHWNTEQGKKYTDEELRQYIEYVGHTKGIQLPFLTQPNRVSDHSGQYIGLSLSVSQSKSITHLSKVMHVTPYIVFLLLFHKALQDVTRQDRHHILTPINGRIHPESISMIGCFVNLLVVNLMVPTDYAWASAIQETVDTFEKAYQFSQIPFSDLIQSLSYNKENMESGAFQTMLSMQNTNIGCLTLPGLEVDFFCRGYPVARVALILELEFYRNTYVGGFYYNPSILSCDTIEDLKNRFIEQVDTIIHTQSRMTEPSLDGEAHV